MPANERRFWLCRNGHIMGEIKKISLRPDGGQVSALMLYENSLACEAIPPAELPPLRQKLIGNALEIKCTLCEQRRDWFIGEDAFEHLMATRAKMNASRV